MNILNSILQIKTHISQIQCSCHIIPRKHKSVWIQQSNSVQSKIALCARRTGPHPLVDQPESWVPRLDTHVVTVSLPWPAGGPGSAAVWPADRGPCWGTRRPSAARRPQSSAQRLSVDGPSPRAWARPRKPGGPRGKKPKNMEDSFCHMVFILDMPPWRLKSKINPAAKAILVDDTRLL